MDTVNVPKVTKWPFFLGDLLLLGFAGYALYLGIRPWELLLAAAVAAIAGAWLAAYPYVLEYRALVRLAEADALQACTDKIKGLDEVGEQIQRATGHWQAIQVEADKVVKLSQSVAGQMTAEARSFTEFLQKANDAEKGNLRLEIDKLRRNETEWMHVAVAMLDHVHALFQAAVRSGQGGLVQQLGLFQNACRDVARRVGLVPFLPNAGDPFDGRVHHLEDPAAQPSAEAKVGLALAPGYTFQGQLLRPALVRLNTAPEAADAEAQSFPAQGLTTTVEPPPASSGSTPPSRSPEEPRLL